LSPAQAKKLSSPFESLFQHFFGSIVMQLSWKVVIVLFLCFLSLLFQKQVAYGQSGIISPSPYYAVNDIFLDRAPEAYGAFGTNLACFEKSSGLEVANPATGSTIMSLGMPSDYLAKYTVGGFCGVWSSFVTPDPSGDSLWVGFTNYGDTDDRIYQVDLSGNWTQRASLVGNFDMQFSGSTAFISANTSGMSAGDNSIWMLNTSSNQLTNVAYVGGYSAGLGADSHGNVYYGNYGFSAGQGLYRFDAKQIANAAATGVPLSLGNADKLTDFINANGPYDLDVDAANNVVFNLNGGWPPSPDSLVAVWNGTKDDGKNYDDLGSGTGAGRWYCMLETAGNVHDVGGIIYVQDYFSPGIARMVRLENDWNGGSTTDNRWTTPENWSLGVPPLVNDVLYFAGTARLSSENDYPVGTNFEGIKFTASAGTFTLTGNRITLTGNVANQSSNLQAIALDVSLNGNATFDTGSGGITVNGVIREVEPGSGLTKKGFGSLTLSQVNTYTGETNILEGNLTLLGSIALTSKVNVAADAELTLAGTSGSSLASGTNIKNDGVVLVAAAGQQCGNITGTGTVIVQNGDLTTRSIVQSTLIIGDCSLIAAVPEPSAFALLVPIGIILFAVKWQKCRTL
jgi:autotransporter-associated beta strand protein